MNNEQYPYLEEIDNEFKKLKFNFENITAEIIANIEDDVIDFRKKTVSLAEQIIEVYGDIDNK